MPESLKKLIDIIAYLPWIWEKTAIKLGFFILNSNTNYTTNFIKQLQKVKEEIIHCNICNWYTDNENWICSICMDEYRDKEILCVVEDYLDMISIERLKIFKWYYFILGWAISPVNWILPKDLNFDLLFKRINEWKVKELIVATNPNIEWEATAMYIKENIPNKDILITRLSKWLPNSWYIEYADEITLLNAFRWRS